MRFEYKTSLGAGAFLAFLAVVYWFWSREPTGTTLLIFGLSAYGLLGSYLLLQWRRRHGIDRPEDRTDATQADGAGEIGFFPAASIWPAGMGLGAIFVGIALVWGQWYWVLAGILILGAAAGWLTEAEAREEGPDDPGLPAVHGHETAAQASTPSPAAASATAVATPSSPAGS